MADNIHVAGPSYGYGYIGIGARDRAAAVALAVEQLFQTAPPDERLQAIASLLRNEFFDERQMAVADRGLGDA
jgi:hypothetical protein